MKPHCLTLSRRPFRAFLVFRYRPFYVNAKTKLTCGVNTAEAHILFASHEQKYPPLFGSFLLRVLQNFASNCSCKHRCLSFSPVNTLEFLTRCMRASIFSLKITKFFFYSRKMRISYLFRDHIARHRCF